jgi:hypothetical protein
LRIEQFRQTLVTDRKVWRHASRRRALTLALADGEIMQPARRDGLHLHFRDGSRRRRLCLEIANKRCHTLLTAFQVDLDSFAIVQHPSAEGVGARQAIHKGAKAHALHHSANPN